MRMITMMKRKSIHFISNSSKICTFRAGASTAASCAHCCSSTPIFHLTAPAPIPAPTPVINRTATCAATVISIVPANPPSSTSSSCPTSINRNTKMSVTSNNACTSMSSKSKRSLGWNFTSPSSYLVSPPISILTSALSSISSSSSISSTFLTKRHFSKKKERKKHERHERKKKRMIHAQRQGGKGRQTQHHQHHNQQRSNTIENKKEKAPPLFLYQTASPTVYISSIAIDAPMTNYDGNDDYDDDNGDDEIDGTYEDENIFDSKNNDENENEYDNYNEYDQNNSGYDDDDSADNYETAMTVESTTIDPKTLFTETKNIPRSFVNSKFEYVPPKLFDYELPSTGAGGATTFINNSAKIDKRIPEIAFLGRSNVGKSSLLNALSIRTRKNSYNQTSKTSKNVNSGLARVSKTPGRTQQVNYFGQFLINNDDNSKSGGERDLVANPPLGYIIDLPGYGYAKAPDDLVNEWQKNTQEFIIARKEYGSLQRVYILIDSRRGISSFDSSIMTWLDEGNVDYTVVLTKCDAVSRPLLVKCANEICMRHHAQTFDNQNSSDIVGFQSPFVHVTSSRKNIGIVELMYAIEGDFYIF